MPVAAPRFARSVGEKKMTSRERVLAVIRHKKPDRIPVYGWVGANLDEQISSVFERM